MADLISSWSKTKKTVPENYIFKPHLRPELDAPICKEIPVINLSLALGSQLDRAKVADQITKALIDYRCFQVINHGVSEKLMEDAIEIYKELFNLAIEEKEKYVDDDPTKSTKTGLLTGSEIPTMKINVWRDALVHKCYPLENSDVGSWPDKPARYRKSILEYVTESTRVYQTIFKLIGEAVGMGKEEKYLEYQTMRTNYYPKSPDPTLTTGLMAHYDPNLVTLLQQNAPGLQILKDGKWVVVEPIANAFLVLPGVQLQVISNGKFKAICHQVGTSAEFDRVSICIFTFSGEAASEPDKAFLSNGDPPKYKDFSIENYAKRLMQLERSPDDTSPATAIESIIDSFLIKY